MLRRVLLMVVVVLIAGQHDAHARTRNKIEFTPFAGFAFGGSFSGGTYGSTEQPITARDLRIKEGFTWGGIINIPISRQAQFEMSYAKQSTTLDFKIPAESDLPLLDIGMNYWQFGFTYQQPKEKLVPFASLTGGVNYITTKDPDFSNTTRFAGGLSLGLKWFPKQQVGVRGQIRGLGTYLGSSSQIFCDPAGFCYNYPNSLWIWQGELSAGLILAF